MLWFTHGDYGHPESFALLVIPSGARDPASLSTEGLQAQGRLREGSGTG